MKDQINHKMDKQTTVPVDIFVGNGARLADKAAVEDYHANSIVSHFHRMSFKMRRPVRLYAMVRDGLSPVKVRSKHLFSRSELPPSFDLSTVRQLESVWYAAMTGVVKDDNLERTANVYMRMGAVGGAVCIVLAAIAYRASRDGATTNAVPEITNAVSMLLSGGFLI